MARPKQARVREVLSLRLPDDRRAALHAEAENRESNISDVIRLHLERYGEIAWRDLPSLAESEWCAVFEALGSPPIDVAAVSWLGATVARVIDEGQLARKWGIEGAHLATRARAWTFGQECAVADAAVRFRRALTASEGDAVAAARHATTRPPELVLAPPTTATARAPNAARPRARRARR